MKYYILTLMTSMILLTACAYEDDVEGALARSDEETWVEAYHFESPEVSLEYSYGWFAYGEYYLYETKDGEEHVVNDWEFLSAKVWVYNQMTDEEAYQEPDCSNLNENDYHINIGSYVLMRQMGEHGTLLTLSSGVVPCPSDEDVTAIVRIGKEIDGVVYYGQIRFDINYYKSPCWGDGGSSEYYEACERSVEVDAKGQSMFVKDTDFYDFLKGNTHWTTSSLSINWKDGAESGTGIPSWLTIAEAEKDGEPGLQLTFGPNDGETTREVEIFKRIEDDCQPAELTLRLTQRTKAAGMAVVIFGA